MQKIQHLCDVCYLGLQETGAQHLGVQFGVEKNQMVVDLCASHKVELDSVLDHFFQAGRRPDIVVAPKTAASKKSGSGGHVPSPPGNFSCPVAGCARSFTGNQALAMHKTRVHQIPGVAKNGQEAHDAAVLAASGDDVAPGTTPKPTYRANHTDEQRERERERDRARKARKRIEAANAIQEEAS